MMKIHKIIWCKYDKINYLIKQLIRIVKILYNKSNVFGLSIISNPQQAITLNV